MKLTKLYICLIAIFTVLTFAHTAQAESDVSKAKASLRVIKTEIRKLKKLVNRKGVRAQLGKTVPSSRDFRDSDDDGLPDIIENVEGTDSCRDDSDDDGVSDGDEEDSGSNPDDSTSTEVELKSTISAITETTVTVNGYTFTVTDSTQFKNSSGLSSFEVGDFVEVSGRLIGGVLLLKKISLED